MFTDYIFLALKNLRKRGIRSWLTMLGIFLGIAAVVSLISLGQGLQTAITGQFGALSTDTLTVMSASTGFGPPGSTAVKKLTEHDLELVKEVQGIKKAIPRLIKVVKVEFNDEANFEYIGSMPENQDEIEIIYDSFNIEASEGKLLNAKDRGKIVLGDDFKRENLFGKEIRVGMRILIQGESFEVSGFAKLASTFTINSAIFMPEKDMKRILDIDDEIDMIAVKVENEKEIEKIAEKIETKMRKDRDEKIGQEDFSVQTPLQSLSAVNTILSVIQLVVSGIAGISLFIGGIGIANTMFTSVLERTKEIGVMKAIGARNKDILTFFVIEAGLLGLIGGIVGALIGLSLAFGVSFFANSFFGENILQVSISYPLLFSALSFSLLIGIIFGIIPAYQASKLEPVEALRK